MLPYAVTDASLAAVISAPEEREDKRHPRWHIGDDGAAVRAWLTSSGRPSLSGKRDCESQCRCGGDLKPAALEVAAFEKIRVPPPIAIPM